VTFIRAAWTIWAVVFTAMASASAANFVPPVETRLYFSAPLLPESPKKKGQPLIEVKLVPERLLVLAGDIIDRDTGKIIAKTGTQFIEQLVAGGAKNFCSHQAQRSNATTTKIMLCIPGDQDRQKMSRYYWSFSAPLFGPGAVSLPQDIFTAANPFKLTDADVNFLDKDYKVQFQWIGGDGVNKPILAQMLFCRKGFCSFRGTERLSFMPDAKTPPIEIFGQFLQCQSTGKNVANCSNKPTGKRAYISMFPGGMSLREED
jgi:hypothetical protein